MTKPITSKMGALWVQPEGPNTEPKFLGCHDVGDLTIPEADFETIKCFFPDGSGWAVIGETSSPPDDPDVSVDTLLFAQRDYLETVGCPFSLYFLMRDCGSAEVFNNYVRGEVMTSVRRTSRTYSNMIMREDDEVSGLSVDMKGQRIFDVDALAIDRITVTVAENLLDVVANLNSRCIGDCGETIDPGEEVNIVGKGAVAATAENWYSADEGLAFTVAAADPFAVNLDLSSVVRFEVGRSTTRYLVVQDAASAAGAQGNFAYTDDDGATWTVVTVGGAAAGEGGVGPGALFALDQHHIWFAGANGSIWFGSDGGQTWTQQEAGTIHAGDYNYIHFADANYGVAGGAADIVAITSDGGNTWAAATAPGAGDDILTVWRFDTNRIWLGTDEGNLWYSNDGGTTWNARTGFTGAGAGDLNDMGWVDDHIGFIVLDSVAPLGTILRTINGGYDWDVIATPTNAGLNSIFVVNSQLAYVVGNDSGGTAVVLKVRAATPV